MISVGVIVDVVGGGHSEVLGSREVWKGGKEGVVGLIGWWTEFMLSKSGNCE